MIAGIEVKASAAVKAGDFSGLRALAEAGGDRFAFGIVLYDNADIAPFGDKLAAAPLAAVRGCPLWVDTCPSLPAIGLPYHKLRRDEPLRYSHSAVLVRVAGYRRRAQGNDPLRRLARRIERDQIRRDLKPAQARKIT